MLPISLSTLTDTFGGTVATAAGATGGAAASGDAAVSVRTAALPKLPPDTSKVGERKCNALLPALAVLFMLSLRASVASCSELEDFSE